MWIRFSDLLPKNTAWKGRGGDGKEKLDKFDASLVIKINITGGTKVIAYTPNIM